MAKHFERIIATDGSAEQIAHAISAPNVEYRVATAEASGLPDRSVHLVTAAQALHWFDFDRFYAEVRRVVVPGGIIAVWSYGACHAGADVDVLLRDFQEGTVGPYWSAGRKWVDEEYRTITFPFSEVEAPHFELRQEWTLAQLAAYVRSWSAVAAYLRARGADPVAPLTERLERSWGPAERRQIRWPLALRVGRLETQ